MGPPMDPTGQDIFTDKHRIEIYKKEVQIDLPPWRSPFVPNRTQAMLLLPGSIVSVAVSYF